MKNILKLGLFAAFFSATTAQAALEVVMITFNKNTWRSAYGTDWKYSVVKDQTFDLKKLINDVDNPNAEVRSYILTYDKGVTQFERMDFKGKLDLSNAKLDAIEFRIRPIPGQPAAGKFVSSNIGGTVHTEELREPFADFGPGFRSAVIDNPGNSTGNWNVSVKGEVELNMIILNIHTNGENCLRNLCR